MLQDYKARWLDKSRYFNDRNHVVNPPPQIHNPQRPTAMLKNNTDYVKFSVDIVGNQGLYQAQIFRDSDHCVLDWKELAGQQANVKFEVLRTELVNQWRVWIQAQDMQGNQRVLPVDFTLPKKKDPDVLKPEKEDDEADRTETYLTLTYDSPDALTPTNPQNEWGWDWGGWQQTGRKRPTGICHPNHTKALLLRTLYLTRKSGTTGFMHTSPAELFTTLAAETTRNLMPILICRIHVSTTCQRLLWKLYSLPTV